MISSLGLDLKRIQLDAQSKNQSLNFSLSLNSAGMSLNLEGTGHWVNQQLGIEASLKGNNVLVINTPEYHLWLSPDLKAQFKNQILSLTGKILIPKGSIKIADFTTTTSLPTDEIVFLDQPKPAETETPNPLKIKTNLKIQLGDQIAVDAAGITGKLKGSVNIRNKAEQPLLANGRIELESGLYNAYGHKLKINKGHLNYIKSPIDNPNLDIQAIRYINTLGSGFKNMNQTGITVGIAINGTIDKPRTALFSEPLNLSQTDILSYLIFGTSSSNNSINSVGLLMQAFKSFNLNSDNTATERLSQRFSQLQTSLGFSELGIESSSVLDQLGNPMRQQTNFVIGKRFSDRTYVRYGIGIDNQVSSLQLQYQLSRMWYIRLDSSSLDTGVDIFYTIERGK